MSDTFGTMSGESFDDDTQNYSNSDVTSSNTEHQTNAHSQSLLFPSDSLPSQSLSNVSHMQLNLDQDENNTSLGYFKANDKDSDGRENETASSQMDQYLDDVFFQGEEAQLQNNINQPKQNKLVDKKPINSKYKVGIERLPLQREFVTAKKGGHFTIMVVGQTGLGKTTFVNTLFRTSLLPSVWDTLESASANVFFKKTTRIIRHQALIEENNIKLKLTVIDTPGFGDNINNSFAWSPIISYIDEQFRSYIFQEEQPNRKNLGDNRIHCCLYFLNPSNKGISPLDIEAMQEISKRVNLIPVIAKADSLGKNSMNVFKEEVKKIINAQGIRVCAFLDENDPDSQTVIREAPFTLVCCDSYVLKPNGERVRGRKYKWGVAEIENEKHSDFCLLRDILMSRNMVDLVISSEKYYETCRSHMLMTRINQAKDGLAAETSEDNVILRNMNYEDPDANGLQNYKCYQIYNKQYMDELIIEWSPEFIHKQWEAKKRFNEIVHMEEKKFKDWKRALMFKQTNFNTEIEDLHNRVKNLQIDCEELESILLQSGGGNTAGLNSKRLSKHDLLP
ncbi:HBL359Cp [Eremothecium sinecaudum]|uniref:HBL359Cp n=1 Tax=Eremothecium sinecaudum TaxID=45286 RepID=A0A109UVW1_9SACH|nr:HBL359Cp [Eremothecium sinecaudum]AMD18543.1 HBL359Cp [Eremothecium sinecaudum]